MSKLARLANAESYAKLIFREPSIAFLDEPDAKRGEPVTGNTYPVPKSLDFGWSGHL
jgi:hypothetical protein